MPSLQVVFSTDFEIARVNEAIAKYAWYKERRNPVALPAGLDISVPPDEKTVRDAVHADFAEHVYLEQKQYLLDHWHEVNILSTDDHKKILPYLAQEYVVRLTRYGIGGSYRYPDTIILNIHYRKDGDALKTVFHEMTHLAIQPLVETYNLGHYEKERITQLLTMRLDPRHARTQKIPIATEHIDAVFEERYPDIESVIEVLGSQKKSA